MTIQSDFLSTAQAAKLLGVSRIAIFKKIKKGDIRAQKIGRVFVIRRTDLPLILEEVLTEKKKSYIEKAVKKVVREYSETLKLLGQE